MEKHIVVLGSINYDITASASRLPSRGETVNGFSVDMFGGGKGANQAVQCARMGLRTILAGQIGNDMQGHAVLEALKDSGIDCGYIHVSDSVRTGCCSIFVDTSGDNMLVLAPGANHCITGELLDGVNDALEGAAVFITQNEINPDAVLYGLGAARKAGVTTVLNPAPAVPLCEEVFSLVDYITPNETECEMYTGIKAERLTEDEWKKRSADWFLERGVGHLCITLGEKGAFYSDGKDEFTVPAFEIKAVDTTAAGDSFHGGLAYGLAHGYGIRECIILGNACGALSAMTLGAQNSIRPKDDVFAFLKERGIEM